MINMFNAFFFKLKRIFFSKVYNKNFRIIYFNILFMMHWILNFIVIITFKN